MSMEIKGRSWDGRRMIYWDTLQIDFLPDQTPIVRFANDTLDGKVRLTKHEDMLYSGLKDIHGTEIYEGDILGSEYLNGNWKVVFKNGSFGLTKPAYDNPWILGKAKNKGNKPEVIGNIYENPELLEKKEAV